MTCSPFFTSGRVEESKVVDFAYFGKSDTDNVCLHGRNYTVGRKVGKKDESALLKLENENDPVPPASW